MADFSYDALTAYGTLGAVAVALLVPLLQTWWRFFSRPILTLEFANGRPFRRKARVVGTTRTDTYFRIKVTNTGFSTARRVSGRASALLDEHGNLHPMFDPFTLHWAGTVADNQDTSSLDLLPQQSEFLDVLRIEYTPDEPTENEFILMPHYTAPRGTRYNFPISEQTVRVSVAADNARGAGIELKLPMGRGLVMPSEQVVLQHRLVDRFGLSLYPWEATPPERMSFGELGRPDRWDWLAETEEPLGRQVGRQTSQNE